MAQKQKHPKRPLQARIPADLYERIEETAELRSTDLTGATQQGLLMWLDESPIAGDFEEMWMLRALRAMRRKHPGLRAKAILSMSVSAEEDADYPLPEALHGSLVRLSREYEEELAARAARRAVLASSKRKTSSSH